MRTASNMMLIRVCITMCCLLRRHSVATGGQSGFLRHRRQQEANFRNNYVGRFQYLLDGGCSGSKPVLQAFCVGDMEVLGTSHSTIECSPIASDGLPEGHSHGFECINLCADAAACAGIYLEGSRVEDGAFGEIYFQCEGSNVTDTGGFFTFEASSGSCGSGNIWGDGRNFHVAQLGVFCESEDDFVFGDAYFECESGSPYREGVAYTCLNGRNCKGSDCEVEFDRVVVGTDLHVIDCIQSLVDGVTDIPEIAPPEPDPRPAGEYSARFRANWELELGSGCTGKYVNISITCTIGEIELLETVFDTTICEQVSPDEIVCQETANDNWVNSYSGAEYRCTATDQKPATVIVYPNATVTCDAYSDRYSLHKVQLGVFCGTKFSGGDFNYLDYYAECDINNGYRLTDDDMGRYTCTTLALVPARTPDTPVPIGEVRMFTDHRWANSVREECYEFEASTDAPNQVTDSSSTSGGGATTAPTPSNTNLEPSAAPQPDLPTGGSGAMVAKRSGADFSGEP